MATQQIPIIDVPHTISHLNYLFYTEITNFKSKSPNNHSNAKGTTLYQYQVDFAYLINEIYNQPNYILPKFISQVHDLLDKFSLETQN